MQLVAYGAQDVYLTGSPQITFFKVVYRRHTNFAVESIQQVFNGTPGFGKKASATISRNGDLITQVFLEIKVPSLESFQPTKFVGGERKGWVRYVNSFAHALVESCEIEIGGQRIDKHYSTYYEVMDELSCPEAKRRGYGTMVGKSSTTDDQSPYNEDENYHIDSHMGAAGEMTYYLPLRFWFNNNPGLALPLISLQYHEVKLQFSFEPFAKLINWRKVTIQDEVPLLDAYGDFVWSDMNKISDRPNNAISQFSQDANIGLYVDYVYLDTDERRRFAQASHEYLIEQLQFTGIESYQLKSSERSEKIQLNYNHPCKELIVCAVSERSRAANEHFNFGENVQQRSITGYPMLKGYDYVASAKLLLNGHERFSERKGSYFRLVVPFQYHTRIPTRHVYCYSFALRPEEHQPSGSCNFSRIDNSSLHLTFAPSPTFNGSGPNVSAPDFREDLKTESLLFAENIDGTSTDLSPNSAIHNASFVNYVVAGKNNVILHPTDGTVFHDNSWGGEKPDQLESHDGGRIQWQPDPIERSNNWTHSVGIWVKPSVVPDGLLNATHYNVFTIGDSPEVGDYLLRYTALQLVFHDATHYGVKWHRGGEVDDIEVPKSVLSLPLGEWAHIVFTYDGNTQTGRIFANGVLRYYHVFVRAMNLYQIGYVSLGIGTESPPPGSASGPTNGLIGFTGPFQIYDNNVITDGDVKSLYAYRAAEYGRSFNWGSHVAPEVGSTFIGTKFLNPSLITDALLFADPLNPDSYGSKSSYLDLAQNKTISRGQNVALSPSVHPISGEPSYGFYHNVPHQVNDGETSMIVTEIGNSGGNWQHSMAIWANSSQMSSPTLLSVGSHVGGEDPFNKYIGIGLYHDGEFNTLTITIVRGSSAATDGNTLDPVLVKGFSFAMPHSTWVHAAYTYSGNTINVYANGEHVGSQTLSEDIDISPNADAYVGGVTGQWGSGQLYTGPWSIYENKILTLDDIDSLYHATRDYSQSLFGHDDFQFGNLYPENHKRYALIEIIQPQASAVNTTEQIVLHVFAISYNILRVMSGMGGLAYSN